MADTYRIAVYPGDGIGVEVTAEAVKILHVAAEVFGFGIHLTTFDWGSAYWRETGRVAPDDFLDVLRDFDVVYLGALGDPANIPDHVTLRPLIEMRQGFDQYVCLRPATLLPNTPTPLTGKRFGDIDIVVVRENSEGEYVSAGGRYKAHQPDEIAVQTAIHSRKGVERILRYAFELARERRSVLTMATKSNAMQFSMVMWDEIFEEVRREYSEVRAEKIHIDALCMNLVLKPECYDVVVGSNLFGDILSDLAGGVTGSLGLAPSANINPERKHPSLFEPVHGSAPDIAGQGVANPIAAIRSAAMMLDFLGRTEAGAAIQRVVIDNLRENGPRTPDIGGSAATTDVGNDIAQRLRRSR